MLISKFRTLLQSCQVTEASLTVLTPYYCLCLLWFGTCTCSMHRTSTIRDGSFIPHLIYLLVWLKRVMCLWSRPETNSDHE